MTAGLGSVAGGFWTQNTNETQQNEHYFQTLHTFWLGPCKEVLVKVWPGVDGALGIWPTGATSGLNCGGGWAPAPNISDMNCLVKSSALVAWPDLFWFRAWTIALFGGPELGCGGGGWAAFPGTLKNNMNYLEASLLRWRTNLFRNAFNVCSNHFDAIFCESNKYVVALSCKMLSNHLSL